MALRQSIAKAASATSPSSSLCVGRDLGSTVEEAISKVEHNVKLPSGYHLEWAGEYASQKRADKRMALVIPITVLAIFLILYTMFRSFKWSMLVLVSVMMASIGGPLALLADRHKLLGFVGGRLPCTLRRVGRNRRHHDRVHQPAPRQRDASTEASSHEHIVEAAVEGSVQRLRPIMMTMLVATLGLLPAAMSHAIGSDSQRPFAIVIVGGLIANLIIGVFLMPALYVWMARDDDPLPEWTRANSACSHPGSRSFVLNSPTARLTARESIAGRHAFQPQYNCACREFN